MILFICSLSLRENACCMGDPIQLRINNLHTSLTELATKLKTLSNGLKTIQNKLAGIEEPAYKPVEQPQLDEMIQAIKEVAPLAAINEAQLATDNERINTTYNQAKDKIDTLKNLTITDAQRARTLEELGVIRQEIELKYQNNLNIGDAAQKIDELNFYEIVKKIQDNSTDYGSVLDEFLKRDTTSLRNPNGYNSIQVVINFMHTILEDETVDANQVLQDALGSMKYRTQTLILFYILLKNNFFNDAQFLKIVAHSTLGYIGQNGFEHLGKCVTAQLLEKTPNMSRTLLLQLADEILKYNNTISSLTNTKPKPKIIEKIFNEFTYFQMTFSTLGLETKTDLLRYILALQADLAILELHDQKPIIDEPIIEEPVAIEPEPDDNKLIIEVSDKINIAPAHVPGASGFPVPKFKDVVKAMLTNLNRDLLNIHEAKDVDILGYFKLFTQKGHQYFMNNPQLKTSYQQMLGLCTIIMKSIFQSQKTVDSLKVKYQNLTLLAVFTNFLFNIPHVDFVAIDDPEFNPVTDCLKKEMLQAFAVFTPRLQKYEHKNKNMLRPLIDWFDNAQRANVQDFFKNTDMPQMGKTIVFQSAFNQLEEALQK